MVDRSKRYQRILDMLALRQPDLTVLMDGVHKPHNLAAIVRTCDAVGIDQLHAVYPHEQVEECHHTASGSNRWVQVSQHKTTALALSHLKKEGYQVVAAHLSDTAVSYRSIDYTKKTCVVVGAELEGVSQTSIEQVDEHIIIPMMGMVQSLNVSVATAIILYEAQRQREEAGAYSTQKVNLASYQEKIVKWLHPSVYRYCKEKQLPLPRLNAEGDIDDPIWQQKRLLDSGTGFKDD